MSRHLWNEYHQKWTWRCDVCGRIGFWEDSWGWYGSIDNVEWAVCSEPCREKKSAEMGVSPKVPRRRMGAAGGRK